MKVDTFTGNPNIDHGALHDKTKFYDLITDRITENINVSLPCKIVEYDRATHKATLRVLFNWKFRDGSIMEGCEIKDITIARFSCGDFLIDMPIHVGDTGWLIATDRDAYVAKQRKEPSLPASPFCNSYASGFWIPDDWGEVNLNDDDEDRLVLQTLDGSQRISIGQNDIKITGTKVTIDAPLEVTGMITATGGITSSDGVVLDTHIHHVGSTASTVPENGG